MDEVMRLGGNIQLTGFHDLNGSEMVVVKKIVGNYARRMEGMCNNFTGLKLRLKPLHKTEQRMKKFELHGQVLDNGHIYPAGIVEHNIYVGIDTLCKKLVNEIR